MSDEFRQEIIFRPAYDKRHEDSKKNYGIHGVEMVWYLYGPKGVIQFVVYTNWHLPEVQEEMDKKPPDRRFPYLFHTPQPADLGYHSHVPRYEGQECMDRECALLGGKCYYDGSGLQAQKVFTTLTREGSEGVWKFLKEYYTSVFDQKEES